MQVAREDGYVKCSFKRPPSMKIVDVETGDGVKTFDLDSKPYHLQVAWGPTWGGREPSRFETQSCVVLCIYAAATSV